MSLENKYIDAIFNVEFITETAYLIAQNNSFKFIRQDDEVESLFDNQSFIGNGEVIIVKKSDLLNLNLKEDDEINIDGKSYIIRETKKNSDGTAKIKISNK